MNSPPSLDDRETVRRRLPALLTLLQDDDDKVASLAMEQVLNSGLAEQTVAEFQEAPDPKLRQRIHQLNGILNRRRLRHEFLEAVRNQRIGGWQGVIMINRICDPQCSPQRIHDAVEALSVQVGQEGATAVRIAALMKEATFAVPDEDVLDVDLYLAEQVLESKDGASALLCAIAQQVGAEAGWKSTLVLHEGRFCLIGEHSLLVDPSENWRVARVNTETQIHPCTPRDLWLGILTQILLVCLVDGNMQDLYQIGDLLCQLNGTRLDDALPHPLGREGAPAAAGE
ncbi:MAG: hypothetical protein WC789_12545 [Lentisphaeria bacterium]|jgi:hypothetical protein